MLCNFFRTARGKTEKMERKDFYRLMAGTGETDYEIYLRTSELLACQSPYENLCNGDELQFQVVHQVEELLMKLAAFTLLDVDDFIRKRETFRVLTLFKRVYRIQEAMIGIFDLLNTMSPREYQEIRTKLGGGSGLGSPGFKALSQMAGPLWESYVAAYLDAGGTTLEAVYGSAYTHSDAYVVAEALADYDAMMNRFRSHHLQHIERSIGLRSKSLKGRPVELLKSGLSHRFFPELWEVRNRMTNAWAARYGEVREPLSRAEEPGKP